MKLQSEREDYKGRYLFIALNCSGATKPFTWALLLTPQPGQLPPLCDLGTLLCPLISPGYLLLYTVWCVFTSE